MSDSAIFNFSEDSENPDRRTQELEGRLNHREYYSPVQLRNRFRLNKHNFLLLVADLRHFIFKHGNHGGLNVVQQLALAFRFYATGQFQPSSTGYMQLYIVHTFPFKVQTQISTLPTTTTGGGAAKNLNTLNLAVQRILGSRRTPL